MLYENDCAMAQQEFERASDLNPVDALGRCWSATFYLSRGCRDFDRASQRRAERADIDPLSAYLTMSLGDGR